MKNRGFELIAEAKKHEDTVVIDLPLRATKTSAGYDFYSPVDITIAPQQKVMVWTDIKAYMKEGEALFLDVTSGIGAKKDCMLANTIGVVDADYYDNVGNEGNIGICLRNLRPALEVSGQYFAQLPILVSGYDEFLNDHYIGTPENNTGVQMKLMPIPIIKDLTQENTVTFKAGEKIGQGIFVNYLTADNCNSDETRVGGYGSTDKKKAKLTEKRVK